MAVAGEEDGDGGSPAQLDGGENIMEDGFGYGGEVVLHIDH